MCGNKIELRRTIRLSGDQLLIQRVARHLGQEWLDGTLGQAAHYADGNYGQPDPRVQVANNAWGDFTAQGGSGPKKNK